MKVEKAQISPCPRLIRSVRMMAAGDYETWASSLPALGPPCAKVMIIQLWLLGRWVKIGRIQTLLIAKIFVAQLMLRN